MAAISGFSAALAQHEYNRSGEWLKPVCEGDHVRSDWIGDKVFVAPDRYVRIVGVGFSPTGTPMTLELGGTIYSGETHHISIADLNTVAIGDGTRVHYTLAAPQASAPVDAVSYQLEFRPLRGCSLTATQDATIQLANR